MTLNTQDADPNLSPTQKITFKYSVFQVYAEIKDDVLIAKVGLKMIVIPIEKIENFFCRHLKEQDQRELVIAYLHRGKLRRARLFSNLHETGFDVLIKFLRWRCPQSDLSHLSSAAAYHQMGSREFSWIVLPMVMSFGILVVALCGLPLLIHGLDRGSVTFPLPDLYSMTSNLTQERSELKSIKELSSHNVKVHGVLDLDHIWHKVERHEKLMSYHLIAPIFPAGKIGKDQPVYVVLSLRGVGDLPLKKLKKQREFKGILRNIGWEGIGEKAYQGLVQTGVQFSGSPLLIEVGAKNNIDLIIYLFLLCFLSMITVVIAFYLKPPKFKNRSLSS